WLEACDDGPPSRAVARAANATGAGAPSSPLALSLRVMPPMPGASQPAAAGASRTTANSLITRTASDDLNLLKGGRRRAPLALRIAVAFRTAQDHRRPSGAWAHWSGQSQKQAAGSHSTAAVCRAAAHRLAT